MISGVRKLQILWHSLKAGVRSGIRTAKEVAASRFYRPGEHPDDHLGWLFTREMVRAQSEQIHQVFGKCDSGISLEKALTGFPGREYGERVVEYPYVADWMQRKGFSGSICDVGCVLNNEVIAGRVSSRFREVWFCNPAVEPITLDPPVNYHISPLDKAFPDGSKFDAVTCLSTIEHIGYDNSQYGANLPAELKEPSDKPFLDALEKLVSLVKPGGHLLVSVPFGQREVRIHRKTKKLAFQVFDSSSLEAGKKLLKSHGLEVEAVVYAAREDGWLPVAPDTQGLRYGGGLPAAGAVLLMECRIPALPAS